MRKLILAFLIMLAAMSLAAADTIYLRSGTTLRGTVLGFINGRFAVQLTTSATLPVRPTDNRNQPTSSQSTRIVRAGEVIFLRPRDIERIEIDGRSLDDARYLTRTVEISLGPNWIDSGVDVRRGERIRVDASGTIYAGRTRITPVGLSTTDPNAPLPRAAEGALIGVVGNDYDSPIIELGSSREFTADRDGRLYLTANRGSYTDARGAFTVRIRKEMDLSTLARTDDDRYRNPNEDNYDPFGFPTDTNPAPTRSRLPSDYNRNRDTRTGYRQRERIISVPANQPGGVDTGIDVRAGDQVTFSASGNITAGSRVGVVAPDGARPGVGAIFGANARPVPTAGVGALVGYLVTPNGQRSQAVLIGSQQTITMPSDGRIFLLVNDDNYNDNSGSFSVRIVYPEYR